jgi:hypothetical protein
LAVSVTVKVVADGTLATANVPSYSAGFTALMVTDCPTTRPWLVLVVNVVVVPTSVAVETVYIWSSVPGVNVPFMAVPSEPLLTAIPESEAPGVLCSSNLYQTSGNTPVVPLEIWPDMVNVFELRLLIRKFPETISGAEIVGAPVPLTRTWFKLSGLVAALIVTVLPPVAANVPLLGVPPLSANSI